MKKRKLDINEIKKLTMRGKHVRTVTTKYQIVLSYFKQNNQNSNRIFLVQFEALIADFLDQLSNAQITYKLEKSLMDQIHTIQVDKNSIKINTECLKHVCKQFPIKQIVECLIVKKDPSTKKVSIEVINNKFMIFFKQLRSIYPQFCYNVGEKIIIESADTRTFYDTFKCEWNKLYERGRMDPCQKIQKLLCRSLYFIGALIENNIFSLIETQQRIKKQEAAEIGTRSEKKRDIKGITNQVSSTYSFGGDLDLISNFSSLIPSQRSNQQSLVRNNYSQKSERILKKQRNCILWQKAHIENMKIAVSTQQKQQQVNETKFEINLLSNDVQNILIEQAFKIQRLKDQWSRNRNMAGHQYMYNNFGAYYPHYYHNYSTSYIETGILPNQQNLSVQGKRTFNYINLVETRKSHSRLQNNRYS